MNAGGGIGCPEDTRASMDSYFLRAQRNKHGNWSTPRLPLVADTGVTPPGHGGMTQKSPEMKSCLIMAIVLLLSALVATGVFLWVILFPMLEQNREVAAQANCENNLRQVGLVCKMYANDNQTKAWPPCYWEVRHPVLDPDSVYPKYLPDPKVAECPSAMESLDPEMTPRDQLLWSSYVYFGYALTDEDEMVAFIEAFPKFAADGADLTQDLPAPKGKGSFGGDTFVHLREDMANPGKIPVVFDWTFSSSNLGGGFSMFNHIPGGANVLFLDGHVEFVKHPAKFPMTRKTLQALGTLRRTVSTRPVP